MRVSMTAPRGVHGRRGSAARCRQRGASLLFALTALAGLTAAGIAMMRTADTSALVAGNIGFHGAAVQAADLALEGAAATLSGLSGSAGHSHNSGVGYYANLASVSTEPPSSRLSDSIGVELTDVATGNTLRYVIERLCSATGAPTATGCILDSSNQPIYRVTTLVRGPRNTSETVQAYMTAAGFDAGCAIMTKGNVDIPGTSDLNGTNRCAFSNGNVNVGAVPVHIGNVAAAGTVADTSKISSGGGTSSPGQPARAFPTFNTNDYRPYVDYVFRSNGQILRVADNTVLGTFTSGSGWNGWYRESTSPVRWRKGNSTSSPAGKYYFEGNVAVSGNVGNSTNPWNVSFIAEGSIQISGECYFQNYTGHPTASTAVKNIFLMARGDIEMNGNSTGYATTGLVISNEELKLNGNNSIIGNLIALNSNNTDPSGLDNFIDKNELSGTTVITYNPDPAKNLWPAEAKRLQWRTVDG
jgi:Tfp pilus assembly protein PilX